MTAATMPVVGGNGEAAELAARIRERDKAKAERETMMGAQLREAFNTLGPLIRDLPTTDTYLLAQAAVDAWRVLQDADAETFLVYLSAVRQKCGNNVALLVANRVGPPGAGSGSSNRSEFPRVWIDDATVDFGGDYLIKGLIDRGRLIVIYGPSGDGKTFFAADMAGHIAAELPWRGRRVRAGLVVYVAAEAGTSILRRFYAWRANNAGKGRTPLAILTRGVNLLNAGNVSALIAELRAIAAEVDMPLELVIFDTLSRSIPGGDENSTGDMTKVVQAADAIRDELSAAVAVVHHTGKDATKGPRGNSSLFAAADTVILVVNKTAEVEKSRDGENGERFPFALDVIELGTDSDGDPLTTCVVRHLDAEAPGQRPRPNLPGVAKIALQALQEAVSDHGQTMPGTSTIPAGVRAVTIEQWRSRFALRYGTDGASNVRDAGTIRKAFQRSREALAKFEAVMVSDTYVWPV